MLRAMSVGENMLVEGDLAERDGIKDVDFRVLTLCERAIEDLVGVMRRDARRGSAVWEVIFRAGVAADG